MSLLRPVAAYTGMVWKTTVLGFSVPYPAEVLIALLDLVVPDGLALQFCFGGQLLSSSFCLALDEPAVPEAMGSSVPIVERSW